MAGFSTSCRRQLKTTYFLRLFRISSSWVSCGSLRLHSPAEAGPGWDARRSPLGDEASEQLLRKKTTSGSRICSPLPAMRKTASVNLPALTHQATTVVWSWISPLSPTLRRRRRLGHGSDSPGPRRPRNGRRRRRGRGKPEVWETPEARGAGGTRQRMRRCVAALAVEAIGSGGGGDRRAGAAPPGGDSEEAWLSACGPKNACGPGP